ncbi:MAG: hypothetical protein L0Z62_05355 [Gemmataceae bacterium]|nr:hypothetical protein [Gemmataceae bacterium]
MKDLPWWLCRSAALAGLALTVLSGCQTYVIETGQTLPSGWYLRHFPQYTPPTPDYPLPRELANLQDAILQPTPPAPRPLIPGP